MEAHELAEKFKNSPKTEQNCQDVVKWCGENAKDLDLTDKDQQFLYEISTNYLMKYKIGKWNKEDANVVINYLAKKSAQKLGIDENVTIKILEESEYKGTYGDDSSAMCINNGDNTFDISYSPTIVKNLLSNNSDQFLRGMQTIFHEVVHAQQNSVIQRKDISGVEIPKNKTMYIMALETIARKYDSKFYKENYSHLIKENHAEKIGLRDAMETIKKYNPTLYQTYNQEVIAQRLESYDKNFYDAEIFLKSGKSVDLMLQIDTLSSGYIEQHPEIIKKFPILQVGYNLDGSKKDLRQLLSERNNMINSNSAPDKINELYEAIANHRNVLTGGLKGTKDELLSLDEYIAKTGTSDEFIFNLVKYRLEHKTKMTPEQIAEFMEKEYNTAAKTREEMQEKEINHEKPESIKDEVGDELKPKTEDKQQEEQQVEAMWQNRFQSWDRDSLNLPNSAKRKEEAVRVIHEIETEKQKEEKEQNQSEQDTNDNR